MSIIVQKYGGSSVADPDKLKQVAARIVETKNLGHSVVVVVSAMGKTTDELLSLSREISASPERRELDMLLTAGERISMALLSMAIREAGGDAISFTGSQAGILTNDRHVDARIIEVRPIRVEDELARGKIVIVAGYQGMSYKREITTLGRGGSDTTAVALAAALDAEWCEICSDVDGVYTADPRIVSEARRIPEMSYEETQEMAEAGAKVLNAQAVEFAKEAGIAIYARATSSNLPGDDPTVDGTVVRKFPPPAPGSVTGVASQNSIVLLRGNLPDSAPLLTFLEEMSISARQLQIMATDEGKQSVSMVLSKENLPHFDKFEKELPENFGTEISLVTGKGAVSIVGAGINANHKNLLRGQGALDEVPVAEVFTSSFRITWIVPDETVEDVVKILHREFVET